MLSIDEINEAIVELRKNSISTKDISDTYHSFGEYIDMRNHLFMALCRAYKELAWKSKKHFDEKNDPMFNGCFIAGINTPDGPMTFHLKLKYWDELDVMEIDNAPMYDGYTDEDMKSRIRSLDTNKVKRQ